MVTYCEDWKLKCWEQDNSNTTRFEDKNSNQNGTWNLKRPYHHAAWQLFQRNNCHLHFFRRRVRDSHAIVITIFSLLGNRIKVFTATLFSLPLTKPLQHSKVITLLLFNCSSSSKTSNNGRFFILSRSNRSILFSYDQAKSKSDLGLSTIQIRLLHAANRGMSQVLTIGHCPNQHSASFAKRYYLKLIH